MYALWLLCFWTIFTDTCQTVLIFNHCYRQLCGQSKYLLRQLFDLYSFNFADSHSEEGVYLFMPKKSYTWLTRLQMTWEIDITQTIVRKYPSCIWIIAFKRCEMQLGVDWHAKLFWSIRTFSSLSLLKDHLSRIMFFRNTNWHLTNSPLYL